MIKLLERAERWVAGELRCHLSLELSPEEADEIEARIAAQDPAPSLPGDDDIGTGEDADLEQAE
jgi:hypothetical protein